MQDYYESQVEGIAGAQCVQCKSIKPLADFKRRLTRAQSRARGYAGNVHLEIESSQCSACRPKPKKVRDLSNKELRNKVASEDLNQFIADSLIKARAERAKAAQRRAATAMWDRKRAAPWRFMVTELGKEITAVRYQEAYAKKVGKTGDDSVWLFVDGYRSALIRFRAWLRLNAARSSLKNAQPPESTWWPRMLPVEERDHVEKLWRAIDIKTRVLMRHPMFLRWAEEPEVDPFTASTRLYQAHAQIAANAKKEEPPVEDDWAELKDS